jgi:hypothetical protein
VGLGRQVFVYAVYAADGPDDAAPILAGIFGSRESAAPQAPQAAAVHGKRHGAVVPLRIGTLVGSMPLLGAIWYRGKRGRGHGSDQVQLEAPV